VNDFQKDNGADYAYPGSFTSTTTTSLIDIYEVAVHYDYVTTFNTSVDMDISLDGGNHWKTSIGQLKFENWLSTKAGGVLETADGSVPWDNKRNLVVRGHLLSTTNQETPSWTAYGLPWVVIQS
jgi:hypothetical protein